MLLAGCRARAQCQEGLFLHSELPTGHSVKQEVLESGNLRLAPVTKPAWVFVALAIECRVVDLNQQAIKFTGDRFLEKTKAKSHRKLCDTKKILWGGWGVPSTCSLPLGLRPASKAMWMAWTSTNDLGLPQP